MNQMSMLVMLIISFFSHPFLSPRSVQATGYDLTAVGSSVTINGGKFEVFSPDDIDGSGLFNTFVRLSSPNAIIRGYNTDFRPVQFDEGTSSFFNRSRLLSEVPQIMDGGILYREFQLDINQNSSVDPLNPSQYLTLDNIELYESSYSNLCGYPFDGSGGGQAGCISTTTATIIFEMDAFFDAFIVLDFSINEGSGKRDLRLRIPDNLFNQSLNCRFIGTGCTVYITIYSEFGGDSNPSHANPLFQVPHGNNDGPEDWGVRQVIFQQYLPIIIE